MFGIANRSLINSQMMSNGQTYYRNGFGIFVKYVQCNKEEFVLYCITLNSKIVRLIQLLNPPV